MSANKVITDVSKYSYYICQQIYLIHMSATVVITYAWMYMYVYTQTWSMSAGTPFFSNTTRWNSVGTCAYVTNGSGSCHTCEHVTWHTCRWRVTLVDGSCHTYERVMCRQHGWVMSHVWMSRVALIWGGYD